MRSYVLILVLASITGNAVAQSKLTPAKAGRVDSLTPIMAHAARCVALSEAHGLLAFGHERTYADAHVSLVKLDAKGVPLAYALPIKLPKPAGLVKNKNYVTGLAFHPKLPLLYVWQEIDVYFTNPPPSASPETMQFDHFCILDVSKETPELVVSMCRAIEFIYGQQGGAIAIDPTSSFLYVPNIREIKNAGSLRIGRYALDADGLPALTDAKDPVTARIKKLAELNAAGKAMPPTQTPTEYVVLFNVTSFGCGQAMHPLGKDVLLTSVSNSLVSWRPDDKNATVHGLPLKFGGHTKFVVHPTLPAIFATTGNAQHSDILFRAEHAEGYLTLLPKQYAIPDSKLSGPPAILSKQKKVAVGGQHLVYLIDLDDKGFPIGEFSQTYVNCPQVRAMIYSERFDRLYVGVELSK